MNLATVEIKAFVAGGAERSATGGVMSIGSVGRR
jgi:hypothetical protein